MTEVEPFEQFMRDYQNMVFSTAARLLVNEAEAKDVSQEVFLKAYERFAELQYSPTVGGWLRKVTTNLCLNHLSRYRNRWRFFSEMFRGDEGDDENSFETTLAAESSTDGEVSGSDDRAMLELVLQQLPPAQRVPLVLYPQVIQPPLARRQPVGPHAGGVVAGQGADQRQAPAPE